MKVLTHLARQPFRWIEIAPQRSRLKLGPVVSVQKLPPSARYEGLFTSTLLGFRHLHRNLVWRQKVVRIKPLNVVSPGMRIGCVSSRGRALVLLCDDLNSLRLELPSDFQRTIFGTVIRDDDYFVRPRRGKSRTQSIRDPPLGMKCRNEN